MLLLGLLIDTCPGLRPGAKSVTLQDYTFIAHGVRVQAGCMQSAPDELSGAEL